MTTNIDGFVVFGGIEQKWISIGGANGNLGHPVSNETPTSDGRGRFQNFRGGIVSWNPRPEMGAHVVWGLIAERWLQIGREQFGYPLTDETPTADGRGRFNHFRAFNPDGSFKGESSIFWLPDTGAHEIYGAIRDKWASLDWDRSPLGYPIGPEQPTFDNVGRFQNFQGGIISWHPATGAHAIYGAIGERWLQTGREQFGYPITDETPTADGRGRFNHFRAFKPDGSLIGESSIFWLPEVGAHEIFGAIRDKWASLDWDRSPLGYPIGPEQPTFDNVGRFQNFQGGIISWHPATGSHVVYGAILERWLQIGREQFGYPITDEMPTPDSRGRFNHFRGIKPDGTVIGDSSIYWLPETGAHEVYGGIRDRWAKRGWENSNVGYPISPEQDRSDGDGREQKFQNGRIVWSPATGALFDPLVFSAPIESGGLAALGGSVTVTINLDGSVRWQGHAHDSGADGYEFGISALIKTPIGRTIALAHTGQVGGTFTSGDRDHDWNELTPSNSYIIDNLSGFNDGNIETHLEYSSDIGSTFESLVSLVIKYGVGSVVSLGVGAIVFVGVELGSLFSTGSLVPGARLLEGVLWLAGPSNTLFALAAAGIASLGSRTRELTVEEYDWANAQVFSGSLPPRNEIVLTDSIGGGNRAFTFPRFDGKTTLNMGEAAFDDPRVYDLVNAKNPISEEIQKRIYGRTFIHELVHACQIHHTNTDLSLLADAFASKVCEATGDIPYLYGQAGFNYSDLNLEQQAQVVSDWFAGSAQRADDNTNHTGVPKDQNSPYLRYINENLRLGNF
jgi:uncharacterized protein with LGFP repeats